MSPSSTTHPAATWRHPHEQSHEVQRHRWYSEKRLEPRGDELHDGILAAAAHAQCAEHAANAAEHSCCPDDKSCPLAAADWSPNGQSGFGYQANWEPEMPEAFKDFVEKALDSRACWDLQQYIPDCSTKELLVLTLLRADRMKLGVSCKLKLKFMANQLRGHVREVVESLHGNHVLQRMLEFMAPKALQFVVEELLAWAPASVVPKTGAAGAVSAEDT
eukprot:s2199_g3.t1